MLERFTYKQSVRISREYKLGKSLLFLSKKYGCAPSCVRNSILRIGHKTRSIGRKLNKNMESLLCGDYKSGSLTSELSKKYSICATTVLSILLRNNLQLRAHRGSFNKWAEPEYQTVLGHYRLIVKEKRGNYRFMPFFPAWNPKCGGSIYRGYSWIIENLGPRPAQTTMHIIDHEKGFVPGNLEWTGRRKQNNQQMYKIVAQQRHRIKYLEKRIAQFSE